MKRLIIDTDVALGVVQDGRPRDIDDGFAICEAINSDEIDLVGISCVFGNAPIDDVFGVAKEIARLKDYCGPIAQGAGGKLQAAPDTNEAVEFLASELSQQSATIAAIGPLTNIALLIKHHPEVAENIDQLIMVAGRSQGSEFFIGQTGPVGDFNFESDPSAARVVLESGVDCVLMGFELTSQVSITKEDLDIIARRGSSTSAYFHENSLAWLDYWTNTFKEDKGFHPWDSATIAWLINPELFLYDQRGHRISSDPPRLECDKKFAGPKHTFCHGFSGIGARSFVETIIAEVY